MPRTRSLAWSELKIGLLAVIAIVLAAVLIFLVGGQEGFFWQRYHLKTRFANVQGLKSGAVVRVAGVEVGKVTDVAFAGAEVEVTMQVSDAMQKPHHRPLPRLDRLAEPAGGVGRRHQPLERRRADRRLGLRPGLPEPASARRRGRERQPRPPGGDPAAARRARGQGHRRPAVHRRQALPRRRRASSRRPSGWPTGSRTARARRGRC